MALLDLFVHNWAAEVALNSEWLDRVDADPETGTEERQALTERPVRRLDVRWTGFTRVLAQRMAFALQRAAEDEPRVPLYCDQAVTGSSSSGTTINVPTARRRFFAGARVAIRAPGGTWEERVIGAISSSTITVTVALSTTYAAGSLVWPLIDCQLVLDSVGRWPTDGKVDVTASFLEVTDSRTLPATATALPAGVDTITLSPAAELPVFPGVVDWSQPVELGVARPGETYGRGRGNRVLPLGTRPLATLSFSTRARREDAWRLIEFFDHLRGRAMPFWVAAPVDLLEAAAFATTHVDVVQAGSITDLQDFLTHVAVEYSNGSHAFAVVAGVAVAGSFWRITFEDPIATTTNAVGVRVAFLMRNATRSQQEEWTTDDLCRIPVELIEVQGHDALELVDPAPAETTPADLAAKEHALLVDISYGATPTHLRLTNWSEDMVHDGQTYICVRDLEVRLPEERGGVDPSSCTIELPLSADPWLERVSDGFPTPTVKVVVLQVLRQISIDEVGVDEVEEVTYLFRGRVPKARRNPAGRTDSVVLEAFDVKARLALPMGIVIGPECGWAFAGPVCQATIPDGFIQFPDVDAIDGVVLTLGGAGLSNPTMDDTKSVFQSGYLELDGLRIEVVAHDWDAPNTITLRQQPPADWLGQEVIAFPGCDKLRTTCVDVYDNLRRRGALGPAISNSHPATDDRS